MVQAWKNLVTAHQLVYLTDCLDFQVPFVMSIYSKHVRLDYVHLCLHRHKGTHNRDLRLQVLWCFHYLYNRGNVSLHEQAFGGQFVFHRLLLNCWVYSILNEKGRQFLSTWLSHWGSEEILPLKHDKLPHKPLWFLRPLLYQFGTVKIVTEKTLRLLENKAQVSDARGEIAILIGVSCFLMLSLNISANCENFAYGILMYSQNPSESSMDSSRKIV